MITKPTLLLDSIKGKANIQAMFDRALSHKLQFRPHFKTHQSLEIGRWYKEIGVDKITVSSFTMAAYFAAEWNDITVAFPVNILEIETINRLANKITLNLTLENPESVAFLSKNLKYQVNAFIKIDSGYHRAGIDPGNFKLIDDILDQINACSLISFKGFLGHEGHTYQCRSINEIVHVHTTCLTLIHKLKAKYIGQYPKLIMSFGDTPSCSVANNFTGIDEIRPGNFVFYDLMQSIIGSCSIQQIAVAMECPIVAVHKDRSEIIIYGGGIHFSKERIEDDNGITYGQVVEKNETGWGNVIEGMYLSSISQEHGIIKVPKGSIENYKVGDTLFILPVHSCLSVNLMKEFFSFEGNKISCMK